MTIIALASFAFSRPVWADDVVPPTVLVTSPTGVNIADGSLNYTRTDLSIGTLSLDRFYSRSPNVSHDSDTPFYGSWTNNFDIFVTPLFVAQNKTAPYKQYTITPVVHLGASSGGMYGQSDFEPSATIAPDSDLATTGTLTYTNAVYVYTDRSGTIYTFNPGVQVAGNRAGSYSSKSQRIASIQYPDGRLRAFTYNSAMQLKFVTDSTGYAIVFEWNASGFISDACGFNLSVTYVDQNTTCASAPHMVVYNDSSGYLTSVTDLMGQTESYSAATHTPLSCIQPPAYSVCKISNSYPIQNGGTLNQTLADGATWQFIWTANQYRSTDYYPDDGDNTVTFTDPNGKTWHFTFTGTSPYSQRTPLGLATDYRYNGVTNYQAPATTTPRTAGSFLNEADKPEGDSYLANNFGPYGAITQQTLHAKANSETADDVVNFQYSCASNTPTPSCSKPDSKKDGNGNETDYIYDGYGNVLTVTSPAGANGVRPQTRNTYAMVTTYALNSLGGLAPLGSVSRLVATSTCATSASCTGSADEVVTTISYGSSYNALPTGMTRGAGDGSIQVGTSTSYDADGNAVTKIDELGAATLYIYDAERRVVGEIGPDPDGSGPMHNRAVRTTYDVDGREVLVETGWTTGQADSDWANFTALKQEATVFDLNDRKIQESVVAGGVTESVTQYAYDGADHMTCKAVRMNPAAFGSLPASACQAGVLGMYGPDRLTFYAYDDDGRQTSVTSGVGSNTQRYDVRTIYGSDGETQAELDANGNQTSYTYDGLNRLSQTFYPNPANGAASSTSDYEQLAYDPVGNITSDRRRDGQVITYGYDALNRKTSASDGHAWNFDNSGKLTNASGNGQSATYTYDGLGRLTAQNDSGVGTVSYGYDAVGNRTQLTWPDGFYVTYQFDAVNEPVAITESSGYVPTSFYYDDLGRPSAIGRANGVATYWSYTGTRLTGLSHAYPSGNGSQTWAYAYNPDEQLVSQTSSNPNYDWISAYTISRSYAADGQNRYTASGPLSLTYDGRGNLQSDTQTTQTYDVDNKLISVSNGAQLGYDAGDRLASVTGSATTQFLYEGDHVIAEYQGGTVLRRYLPGNQPDQPNLWYEGSDTSNRRWFLTDRQGSVVGTTDGSASPTYNTYDEAGLPGPSNSGRFQYDGQFYLEEVGLYNFRARVYSPTLGRFMQTDPIGYKDGLNWYSYTHDDPINGSDPKGTDTQPPIEPLPIEPPVELVPEARAAPAEGSAAEGNIARVNPGGATFTDSTGRVRTPSAGGPGSGRRISPGTRAAERAASGNKCVYCGRLTTNKPGQPNSSQADHIASRNPRDGGLRGNNSPQNTGNACATCNLQKTNLDPFDFLRKFFGSK